MIRCSPAHRDVAERFSAAAAAWDGAQCAGDRGAMDQAAAVLSALRREAFALGVENLDALARDLREPSPADVAAARRRLADLERRMARMHRRASSRVQATTREARLGQLARAVDACQEVIRRAAAHGVAA